VAAASAACAACKSEATARKLAGAALTSFMKSFMKKCERDATASCEQSSVELKLAGGKDQSHEKCVDDAVGK